MTATATMVEPEKTAPSERPARVIVRGRRHVGWHIGSATVALLWFSPIALILVTAVRSVDDVNRHGVASFPESFTLANYADAWTMGGMGQALVNSLLVTIPSVLITLALASAAAFGLSRFRIPFWRTILLLMLAGNLLPVQVALIPVTKLVEQLGLFDTLAAVSIVQIVFGLGFYTFVLYGFMRSIPNELQEAAQLDGVGPIRLLIQIILPLARPALAALAALSFTWIFNDLLWSISLLQSSAKFPVTAAVLTLNGQFTSVWPLISAGAVIAAVPCVVVFLFFQRSFVGGLSVGAVK